MIKNKEKNSQVQVIHNFSPKFPPSYVGISTFICHSEENIQPRSEKSKNHNFSQRQKITSHNNSYPSSTTYAPCLLHLRWRMLYHHRHHLIRDAKSSVTNAIVVVVHQLPLTLRSPRAIAINRWVGKCDVNNIL